MRGNFFFKEKRITLWNKFVNVIFVNMELSVLLKEGRIKKEWSLRKLGAETSIDSSLLNKFEKGERIPTKPQINRLLEILELDKKETLTLWLGEKIYRIVEHEEFYAESMMFADHKISYGLSTAEKLQNQLPERLQTLLSDCDVQRDEWNQLKPLNGIQLQKMNEYFRLNYTYESNRIEGNTLTLQETHLVINEGLTIGGKSMREHLEVVNHSEAIEYISEIVQNKVDFTERVLKQIHYLILKGIDRENAGVYRSIGVRISGSSHLPPEPFLLSRMMEEVFEYYQKNKNLLHPIILAAEMNEQIVRIHPFIDGNGRTTRLIMNLILLQNGFPIANIKGDLTSRLAYYKALENAPGDQKASFYELVADTVKTALNEHIELSR
jgi:Fic family protein/DNA-binding Xre family transcriptional regulator